VESKNIIGSRVREARKLKKPPTTQLDLIARLQVLGIMIDQSALSKLENGQRPVTDIEVAALSEALNVPVAWLFKEIDIP
jgi:transcriptional regulator with XRE-family HTH domain